MEPLQRLTRRQLSALQAVSALPASAQGVALRDLARALRVRPPSALAHLRALERLGLVQRAVGKSRLTVRGDRCLAEYRLHHRVAETMFSQLHLPAADACQAASEIDLALSHGTVERLWRAAGEPDRCPHGEPIGAARRPLRRP